MAGLAVAIGLLYYTFGIQPENAPDATLRLGITKVRLLIQYKVIRASKLTRGSTHVYLMTNHDTLSTDPFFKRS